MPMIEGLGPKFQPFEQKPENLLMHGLMAFTSTLHKTT
jgi:hypothetical protein